MNLTQVIIFCPRISMERGLKKNKSPVRAINRHLSLIVEKGIRWEIYHAIHQYRKAKTNTSNIMKNNKESLYLKYFDMYN